MNTAQTRDKEHCTVYVLLGSHRIACNLKVSTRSNEYNIAAVISLYDEHLRTDVQGRQKRSVMRLPGRPVPLSYDVLSLASPSQLSRGDRMCIQPPELQQSAQDAHVSHVSSVIAEHGGHS